MSAVSVENCWYGEIENRKEKKNTVGIYLNLYKVYFVVCFPFMGRVSDKYG